MGVDKVSDLAIGSLEKLIRGLGARRERQVKALEDTDLQLNGARQMYDEAIAKNRQMDIEAAARNVTPKVK